MVKYLILFILLIGTAHADIQSQCRVLNAEADITATDTSDVVQIPPGRSVSFWLVGNNDSGSTPTMDVKIQQCRDIAGTDCRDMSISFAQCTTGSCAPAAVSVASTTNITKWLKVVATLGGGSPQYDYTVYYCR